MREEAHTRAPHLIVRTVHRACAKRDDLLPMQQLTEGVFTLACLERDTKLHSTIWTFKKVFVCV